MCPSRPSHLKEKDPLTADNIPAAPAFAPSDLTRFVDLLGGVLVPPGDSVLYVANTRDGVFASPEGALWVVRSDGTGARVLSEPAGAQSKPAVSADGQRVAFLQVEDGNAQVCVRPMSGGSTSVLTSFRRGTGPIGPKWSPDGQRIAFDGCEAAPRDKELPYRITRPIWRRDGMGLVDDTLTDIYVVAAEGGEPQRLTFEDGVIGFHSWSADGSQILFLVFGAPGSRDYEIKIADYPAGKVRTVASGPFLAYPAVAAWLPDGRVAYTSPWSINKRIDLIVFDPERDRHDSRAAETDGQLFGLLQAGFNPEALEPRIVVDPAGTDAYVYIQQGGSLVAHRIALGGDRSVQAITEPAYSSAPLDVCGRRLLTLRSSFTAPADLHLTNLDTGETSQLTALNAGWLSQAPFDVRHLTFKAEDSTEVEGWYLEPHQGSRPHPTVLHIHGGPFAAHGQIFSVDNLFLTASGYGVLSVNFRGGSGYGDDFASMLIGDWGRCDLADLLQGVDTAVELGLADTERVASFGLSGGGYLTSWLLTHSDRFRAGVAECLVSDWAGMLASDISSVIATWMASDPGHGEASMAPYVRMAPSTYAAACSAPLLIIAHEGDLRCPATQGDILYNELQLAGKEVEMLRLPDVPHLPYGAALRVRAGRSQALLDWMDRYVR
jgi:dipeptidyl aminopeptidase/acylaminoacyl peptidase